MVYFFRIRRVWDSVYSIDVPSTICVCMKKSSWKYGIFRLVFWIWETLWRCLYIYTAVNPSSSCMKIVWFLDFTSLTDLFRLRIRREKHTTYKLFTIFRYVTLSIFNFYLLRLLSAPSVTMHSYIKEGSLIYFLFMNFSFIYRNI